MPAHKISISAIHDLQRVLDESPEYNLDQVNMLQAIELLAPHIQAMQSKGYDMDHIASVLTAKGVAIRAVTLKSYLTRCAAGAVKSSRKSRSDRAPVRATSRDTPQGGPSPMRSPSTAAPVPRAGADRESAAADRGPRPEPRPVLAGNPPAPRKEPQKGPQPAPAPDHRPLYAGFTPRPDTEDI